LTHHFVSLLLPVGLLVVVLMIMMHLAAAFLAMTSLVEVFFELICAVVSRVNFIRYISGDRALNVVELAKALNGDYALSVFLDFLVSLALLHLLHLVLGEDVGGAGDLRRGATLARIVGLLQLLESAGLQATASSAALLVFTDHVFVESIADSLAESVDTGVAGSRL